MASTHHKFRFVRKAARSQWYLSSWGYVACLLVLPGLIFLKHAELSWMAWVICAVICGALIYRWRQMIRFEREFWAQKSKLLVWFEDGRLFASSGIVGTPESESLTDIVNIDAQEEKGRVVRVFVDKTDGSRSMYDGLDDMERFATELKLNAQNSKFRRVKLGFPMKLKEI